ncbi:unnamed protein product [Paramecium pentaurelia]|uniref:CRC domain-containing protein n=1 Tax=Paramecium pentaurelia TaxID=43138 RepID=A0A8S1T1U7_9CILI|nr:unnamed protein product [Paramecium pentaurelia]
MNTRASKKQSLPLHIPPETRTKQEELIGEPVITKVNIDNEESNNKITSLNFRYNQGIKKLQITKTYPNEKSGFKAHKTRNKPIVLNLLNCLKQGVDGKLYDVMDVNTYIQFMNDQQQSQNIPKSLKCKCNKSMCLKQYCDCFANGNMCTTQCQCQGCHNTEEYLEERDEAINKLKMQNQSIEKEVPIGISCKCKKSKCLKRYCDCFQNYQKCNETCQCFNCSNQLEKVEQGDQRLMMNSISQFDENSRLAKSPIVYNRQGLFRRADSMNYSNSFGYSRRMLIQHEGPYILKQDSQGFN